MSPAKRRKKSEIPRLDSEDILKIIEKAKRQRDKCLIALLFLSGRRIQEVLSLRKQDFNFNTPQMLSFTTFNEKSYRQKSTGEYNIPMRGKYYEQIEPKFSLEGPSGSRLSPFITAHLEQLDLTEYLFAPLRVRNNRTNINRFRAYQILRELDERLWLHALRHLRFTSLARVYRDNPVAMHSLTFHKQFESTLGYIRPLEVEERLSKT